MTKGRRGAERRRPECGPCHGPRHVHPAPGAPMSLFRPLRLARLALAPALLLLPLAAMADWRDIPYEDVAKMPLMLQKVAPGHVYSFSFKAGPMKGQAMPADFRLQLKLKDGQLLPVKVAPDGRVDMPIRQDW